MSGEAENVVAGRRRECQRNGLLDAADGVHEFVVQRSALDEVRVLDSQNLVLKQCRIHALVLILTGRGVLLAVLLVSDLLLLLLRVGRLRALLFIRNCM